MSNDYGMRRTATANGAQTFGISLSYTPNYTIRYDFYSVITSNNVQFNWWQGNNCNPGGAGVASLYFAFGKIQQLRGTNGCASLHDLAYFSDGNWIQVTMKHVNFSQGVMDFYLNGSLINKSLSGSADTGDLTLLGMGTDGGSSTHAYFDTIRVCQESNGECPFNTKGIVQSYPIFFNTSFNQVNCTYLASTPAGTSANVNVSANNGTSWVTCNNNAVTSLGATVSNIIVNIELKGNATARPMMNYALNLTLSNSGGVQGGGGNSSFSNEMQGDDAIERAINTSFTYIAKFKSRQLYARYFNNTQMTGRFDWFVAQSSPKRRWAINYVAANDTTSGFTYMLNITPVFYVIELQNLTEANITDRVGNMFNLTKS